MTTPKRFDLVIQALAELGPELRDLRRADPVPAAPSLDVVLGELGSLPRQALFLGVAEDSLPVLLDLNDPAPGPLLLAGDARSGKTDLLRVIAAAIAQMHAADDVQFGVVTPKPEEWDGFENLPNCAGIYPLYDTAAMDFILGLTAWAHNNRTSRQVVLLLLDDFSQAVEKLDFDAQQNLRWLLMRGPNRRVWPVVTLESGKYPPALAWLEHFRTRLFGNIADSRFAEELSSTGNGNLAALVPGVQFALREGRHWLKFWIPSLGD